MMAKMTNVERAKQFLPFASLRGYDDLVKNKKEVVSFKKELSYEQIEEINKTLCSLNKGDMVNVEYFLDGRYITFSGVFSGFDELNKYIVVVKTKIKFEDLYDIKKI